MARSYGVLKVSVWEPGSEFRSLSPIGQWAYTMLLSQPQVSNLGVLPYTPEKWARFAAGLDVDQMEAAIAELEAGGFVIVDRDVGELLVRTFIKHDKVWSQPKLVTNARKIVREVESAAIHTYLTMRHPWLNDDRPKPEIELYELSAERGIETPSDRGIETPSHTHIPPARAQDVRASRAPAGAGAGPGPGAAADREEQLLPLETAAADEAPRLATITAAAARYSADVGVLEPEARAIPALLFDDVIERVHARCETGHITNPAGLLIQLTRKARKEADKRAAIVNGTARPVDEDVLFDARSYARGDHPWDVAAELITRKLTRLEIEVDDQVDLLERAADAYNAERPTVASRSKTR